MLSVIRKISAFLLALLVFCSSVSFVVNKHFCEKNLVDFSFFKEAKKCNSATLTNSIDCELLTTKSCCEDQQLLFDALDLTQLSTSYFSQKEHLKFIFNLPFQVGTAVFYAVIHKQKTEHYIPLLLTRDIQHLHQVYLI